MACSCAKESFQATASKHSSFSSVALADRPLRGRFRFIFLTPCSTRPEPSEQFFQRPWEFVVEHGAPLDSSRVRESEKASPMTSATVFWCRYQSSLEASNLSRPIAAKPWLWMPTHPPVQRPASSRVEAASSLLDWTFLDCPCFGHRRLS